MKERIGFIVPPMGGDMKQIIRIAQMADEMGFHSIWAAEAWGKDAFTVLTAIACRTKRIQIGTAIVNNFSRTAGVLAMTAATLDEISEGRFILGLGTSGNKVIEGFHGVPFDKPLTRLKEYVSIIRILLRGGRVSEHQGEMFKLDKAFKLQFKPARADMPIYIASLTPKSIEQTGEIADGWIPTYYPLSKFSKPLGILQKGMEKAGKKKGDVKVSPMLTFFAGDDVETGRFMARSLLTFYITKMGKFYYEMLSREGYQKECDEVRKLTAEGKPDAMNAIPVEMLDDITVYGTPQTCKEKLQKWVDAGIDFCLAPMPPVGDDAQVKKIMEGLV